MNRQILTAVEARFLHYQRRYYYSMCDVKFFILKFLRVTYMWVVHTSREDNLLNSSLLCRFKLKDCHTGRNNEETYSHITNECSS